MSQEEYEHSTHIEIQTILKGTHGPLANLAVVDTQILWISSANGIPRIPHKREGVENNLFLVKVCAQIFLHQYGLAFCISSCDTAKNEF